MGEVTLSGVTKHFGDVVAVDGLTIEARDHEFLVLLGPSGCGKSTVLRMIAGLDEPSSGAIRIAGRVVNEIEPEHRDVAMVFQSYALYPHMTVRKNIAFPLRARHVPAAAQEEAVQEASRALGLDGLLDRRPAQLSGGQRQRVALARAIVRQPAVFLMDEPLSNLDAKLRVQTRAELIELQRRLAITVIYVTHDQVEAMTMGDRIAVLDGGRLQQVGPPQTVYGEPANLFVARFLGNPPMNTIPGSIAADGDTLAVQVPGATIPLPADLAAAVRAARPEAVVLGVRPEHLVIGADGMVPARVAVVESLGHEHHVVCRLADGQFVIVRVPTEHRPPDPGDDVRLSASAGNLHVFDAVTEERIRR